MFEGLKEKLGRFKSDVEEGAEEAAAEETAAAGDADSVSAPESEPEAPAAEADSGAAPDAGDADEEPSKEERIKQAQKEAKKERGLGERAKMFATGKTVITEEELEEPLEQLELALLQGDVEMSVASAIVERLRENLVGQTRSQVQTGEIVVENAIGDALKEVISVGQFDFDARIQAADKPVTIIFTGINGVGKTTSIAKLSRYLEERGLSSVIANGDTYRAGANEQIREHAAALDTKLIAHEQGGDPAAVIYDAVEYAKANDIDVVLGDTAGRLHTSNDLMSQLEKIDRVVGPDLTLFVDEAVAGQDATQRAQKFDEAAEIDGVILTKADADSSGGAAISIAHVTGKPILFLGVGQGYDDLERFDPEVIVDRIIN
ncbi:signal recognition particle-docking protein FtsY [Natronomonas sp. EA1]|uniref:signal recognition particle-docking protein FtsY n=1 Tax=Natronomonas sp. EA1 TaxID=3421655 RepID=UPI003EB86370